MMFGGLGTRKNGAQEDDGSVGYSWARARLMAKEGQQSPASNASSPRTVGDKFDEKGQSQQEVYGQIASPRPVPSAPPLAIPVKRNFGYQRQQQMRKQQKENVENEANKWNVSVNNEPVEKQEEQPQTPPAKMKNGRRLTLLPPWERYDAPEVILEEFATRFQDYPSASIIRPPASSLRTDRTESDDSHESKVDGDTLLVDDLSPSLDQSRHTDISEIRRTSDARSSFMSTAGLKRSTMKKKKKSSQIISADILVQHDVPLSADSVGANVHIYWQKMEYTRVHFAAIHVPWSRVRILRDAAVSQNPNVANFTSTGTEIMYVDLSSLKSDHEEDDIHDHSEEEGSMHRRREPQFVFGENFESIFGDIFRRQFIPLVHAKFNGKGEISRERLPSDVRDLFKLLVIAERLDGALKHDIFSHILALISADEGEFDAQSASFALVETCITFEQSPPPQSLQASIIDEAVETLISYIPESLPFLEKLVETSCQHGQFQMAARIFRESTSHALQLNAEHMEQQASRADQFFGELETKLNIQNRTKCQFDIFAELLSGVTASMKQTVQQDMKNDATTATSAGFQQGILLHKVGAGKSGGSRFVRIDQEFLQWKKPGKKGDGKLVNRRYIDAISAVSNDNTKRAFYISSSRDGFVTFRADTPELRDQCVSALLRWWKPDEKHKKRRKQPEKSKKQEKLEHPPRESIASSASSCYPPDNSNDMESIQRGRNTSISTTRTSLPSTSAHNHHVQQMEEEPRHHHSPAPKPKQVQDTVATDTGITASPLQTTKKFSPRRMVTPKQQQPSSHHFRTKNNANTASPLPGKHGRHIQHHSPLIHSASKTNSSSNNSIPPPPANLQGSGGNSASHGSMTMAGSQRAPRIQIPSNLNPQQQQQQTRTESGSGKGRSLFNSFSKKLKKNRAAFTSTMFQRK